MDKVLAWDYERGQFQWWPQTLSVFQANPCAKLT